MEKIPIRDIGEQGLNVHDTIDSELFGLTKEDYLWLIEPVQVDVFLKKFESTVLGDVRIRTRFASTCCRTMENVERDLRDSFELDYEIEPEQEYLELEDDIRQEIFVRLPTRVLSDGELKKENAQESGNEEDLAPENTYRPFAGLKDLET